MIDPIFNMFKIRFATLDEWNPFRKDKVRIFISLESVFKVLFTSRVNNYAVACNDTNDVKVCLISNIINLAQHYRLYCTKNHIDSEIYIYWNYPKGEYNNYKYNSSYKSKYSNKVYHDTNCYFITKCISECYKQLKIISKYMNQVYVIDTPSIESSVVPFIIYRDRDDDCQNIIVSNSKYDYQYTLYDFDIWIPNRDKSIMITKDSVLQHLKELNHIKSNETVPVNYVPFILSLLGDRYRNISKITGVGLASIIKLINIGIEKGVITENTTNVEMLSNCLKEEYKEVFRNNYHCVDVAYQYKDIEPLQLREVFNQIIDKYDDNAIYQMNDRFFQNHLLMTIEMKREQVFNGKL